MASTPATANSKTKTASTGAGNSDGQTKRQTTAKPSASKRRATAQPKTPRARRATNSAPKIPQWLTIGASVTGAVVAVGATLFATRNEWLPRAKKLGGWLEKSVQEQFDNAKSKLAESNEPEAPVVRLAATGV